MKRAQRAVGADCGDSLCRYAVERTGQRTNGGCRCDACPGCGRRLGPPGLPSSQEHAYDRCATPRWEPPWRLIERATRAIEDAVAEEREACAQLVDEMSSEPGPLYTGVIVSAIRVRGGGR